MRSSSKSRPSKKLTPEYLNKVALWYVERYASSAASLRRALLRRVRKWAADSGVDEAEAVVWVDRIVARYVDANIVDDRRFAESKTQTLHRQGVSRRSMVQKMRAWGLAPDIIDGAMKSLANNVEEDADVVAAVSYARRRRLGPYRSSKERKERRDKDMAALARRGFSYEVARRVIDALSPQELPDPL